MAAGICRAERGDPGGIAALADLLEAHRGAFEYDWRARFHLPLSVVGKGMSWGEALRLTLQLRLDPSSHVFAAVAEWDYPMSRSALVAADAFDVQLGVAWGQSDPKRRGNKPNPYPRPYSDGRKRIGTAKLTPDELRAVLDKHREGAAGG